MTSPPGKASVRFSKLNVESPTSRPAKALAKSTMALPASRPFRPHLTACSIWCVLTGALRTPGTYPRDVSLHEDACRVRYPLVQHALATLNNLVLGLIRLSHFDSVPAARRFFDANVWLALQLVI